MEQDIVSPPTPAPGSLDKSIVYDIKPIRCYVPKIPHSSSISAFPSNFSPFYPFSAPDFQNPLSQTDNEIPSPIPTSSFKALLPQTANESTNPEEDYVNAQNYGDLSLASVSRHTINGENSGKNRRRKRENSEKRPAYQDPELEPVLNNYLVSFDNVWTEEFRAEGDKESTRFILMLFDLIRRKIIQIEDAKEPIPGFSKQPHLRAGTLLMNKGVRTNIAKSIGVIPGIEVGDIFFFRFELCLVGLHGQIMGGIDYMNLSSSRDREDPLAVSIVSSGSYADKDEDSNVLIYSGQGEFNQDQKLEKGNLALEKSLQKATVVRVIRGLKDPDHPKGKIYVYDGLYEIQESWIEKGNKSNCNVFKYRLLRNPSQPRAFAMWTLIQNWKVNIATRPGLILTDISSGAENLPVCLVNEVNKEKDFPSFTYLPSLKFPRPITSKKVRLICFCPGGCEPGDPLCPCVLKNGGFLAYTSIGVLLNYKNIIYECGPSCVCPISCRNRISQTGIKFRLEVFKTKNKGWGLRSWDPIRAGAFICEYTGEVIPRDNGDEFIFDATRTFESLKLFMPGYASEAPPKMPFPLVISAENVGNAARFMNHSCMPNVYWQPVVSETENESYIRIAFFAVYHIAPMQELTFDYGTAHPGKTERGRKKCLCGTPKCKGQYY